MLKGTAKNWVWEQNVEVNGRVLEENQRRTGKELVSRREVQGAAKGRQGRKSKDQGKENPLQESLPWIVLYL